MVVNVWNRQVGTLVTAAASIAHLSGRHVPCSASVPAPPRRARGRPSSTPSALTSNPTIAARHARVRDVLDLAAATWRRDRRRPALDVPAPLPCADDHRRRQQHRAQPAGRRACRRHQRPVEPPGRDEFLAAADAAAGDRPFLRTAYISVRARPARPRPPDPDRDGGATHRSAGPRLRSGPHRTSRPACSVRSSQIPPGRVGTTASGDDAEGATTPESLRQPDRSGEATLESSRLRSARRRGKPEHG